MRYNSYTLYFKRSDNKCYELLYEGFIKPFTPRKSLYNVQHEGGKYISRSYYDLIPANAAVYSVRVAVREDSEFFNWEKLTYFPRPEDFPGEHAYALKDVFGREIQRIYHKEIEKIIADAIEI